MARGWMGAHGVAVVVVLLGAPLACEVPPDTSELDTREDAFFLGGGHDDRERRDGCEVLAEKARVAALRRRESPARAQLARDLAYIDCALDLGRCSRDRERACRAVAKRRLEAQCSSTPSVGALAAAIRDELAHCDRVGDGDPIDLEACAARVPPRSDLEGRAREVAYQTDIGSYCGAPGSSACGNQLIARANVDYTAAATQVVAGRATPAQYLALSLDRTRKLRVSQENAFRAFLMCNGRDSDGDWVVDSLDRCPNTPDLVATDDNGCPLAPPPGPPTADVARILSQMHLAVSPRCAGAEVPARVPAGGFYFPSAREKGSYLFVGAVENQPAGCPVWYEFEIEEISGPSSGYRYGVAFLDREALLDTLHLGRPVAKGFVQFNPRPGDAGERARLATTGGRARVRFRVRVMNGAGVRGPWSDWKITDRASCLALGFECSDSP